MMLKEKLSVIKFIVFILLKIESLQLENKCANCSLDYFI